MPGRAATLDLALVLPEGTRPGFRWLYEALRAEILEGRLKPGARLPSSRDMARQFGLSRGTIVNAFEQLKAEGYIEGAVGAGTTVSAVLPDELLGFGAKRSTTQNVATSAKRELSAFAQGVQRMPVLENRVSRAFRPNLPAIDLFPQTLWAQLVARRLRGPSSVLLGCETLGYRPLREAIAAFVGTSRGVKCAPEQIAIVSGAQEAFDLIARLVLDPGDRVCVEDPGYEGITAVCEAAGAVLCPVPVDDEGAQVPADTHARARLYFVTPGHQHPLGITMSLRRRLALLEWARTTGALVVEDDYDGEYRYRGRPVPALQGLDRHGQVLFVGTFSKVLFPALRLGYLVLPADLVPYVEAAKSISNRHLPLLEQAVLCDFIEGGHFGRHLRRMREVYAERLGVLLEAAREKLSGLLEISDVEAGLQTSGWLREGIDGEAAAAAARERNVEVTSLSRFARTPLGREGLQLGFAAVNVGEIKRGVNDLARALEPLANR